MSAVIEILHASEDHLNEIAPLFDEYRQFYGSETDPAGCRSFLAQRFRDNESTIFLARLNGEAVAFTQLYPLFSSVAMERIWILNDLYVRENARRHSIGLGLLETAAQFAEGLGAIRLELATGVENHAAQALYEKHGWTRNNAYIHFTRSLT